MAAVGSRALMTAIRQPRKGNESHEGDESQESDEDQSTEGSSSEEASFDFEKLGVVGATGKLRRLRVRKLGVVGATGKRGEHAVTGRTSRRLCLCRLCQLWLYILSRPM